MIKISNLNFSYNKRKVIFSDLNLALSPGHIYGLLGKNGAGKTTLLNLMSGMIFSQSGKIDMGGKIPSRREVGFLQDFFLLPEEFYIPSVTPLKYVKLYSCFYPKFSKDEFSGYLKELEVDPEQDMNKMSMGQRKKAFIAFALACNTRILFMDEPTNGLDIPSKTQFRRLLASAVTEDRLLLVSTHQVRDLDHLIDTVVILEDHQIIFNQSLDEVSEILQFLAYTDSDKPEGYLYDEPGVLGGKVLLPNRTGKPSRIDMELLFNAIVAEQRLITDLFNEKKQ